MSLPYTVVAKDNAKAPKSGCRILSVAPGSIADDLGVQAEDLLLSVDDEAPHKITELSANGARHKYQIYKRSNRQLLYINARQVPLGIDFTYSREYLIDQAKTGLLDVNDLTHFFCHSNFTQLGDVLAAVYQPTLIGRIIGWWTSRNGANDGNRCLIDGLYAYSIDEVEQATNSLVRFINEFSQVYTADTRAMAHYVLGLCCESLGYESDAEKCFDEAYSFHDLPLYESKLRGMGLEVPQYHPALMNKDLPLPIQPFELLRSKDNAMSLQQAIATAKPGQVTWLCSVGPWRANGPYEWFLVQFRYFANLYPDIFERLYVLTENQYSRDSWQEVENLIFAQGLIEQVIWDQQETSWNEALGIAISPVIFAIDNQGKVIYQGKLEKEGPVFELIAKLQQQASTASAVA